MPKKPRSRKIKGGLTKIEKGAAYVLCMKPMPIATKEAANQIAEDERLTIEYFRKHGADLTILVVE
jgi:hypothetical protein